MSFSARQDKALKTSYLKILRLVFVLFALYLLGDVFFRWDGFRLYASFNEFLPSVALIFILWSITAAAASFFLWLTFRAIDLLFTFKNGVSNAEYLIIFIFIFILAGITALLGKRLLLSSGLTFQVKLAVLISTIIISAYLTWLLRDRINQLVNIIQENITPLVSLFSIFLLVSFPLVTYHTWLKAPEKEISHHIVNPTDTEIKSLPNIILVTFDAMTTMDMSAYGYHRDTTPYIKKWSEDASLFTRAYSAGTTTSTTTASLMTGKRLWTHQRFNQIHGGKLPRSNIENIAAEMKKLGYYNMVVATNGNASVSWMGISESFDYYVPWADLYIPTDAAKYIKKQLYNVFGRKIRLYEWLVMEDFPLYRILSAIPLRAAGMPFPPETTIERFTNAINYKAKNPYFIWVHFHPPHAPYTPPEPFKNAYNSSMVLTKKMDQQKMMLGGRLNKLEDLTAKRRFLRILRDRYDENMLYCDSSFKTLIDRLREMGELNNSIIMLSSDHGESFDHDYYGHGGNLYEPSTHIPLIIKDYRILKGQKIDTLVGHEDISATILGLAGLKVPSWMDGRSLVPLLRSKEFKSRPVFSMNLDNNTSGDEITKGDFAVWEGDHKLILNKDNTSQLFNLRADPEELHDLSDSEPELRVYLESVIQTHLKSANQKIAMR